MMDTIWTFFSKIRTPFLIFKKRQGRLPLSPSSCTPDIYKQESHYPYGSVAEVKAVSSTHPAFHCHASFLPQEHRGWLLVRWVLQNWNLRACTLTSIVQNSLDFLIGFTNWTNNETLNDLAIRSLWTGKISELFICV